MAAFAQAALDGGGLWWTDSLIAAPTDLDADDARVVTSAWAAWVEDEPVFFGAGDHRV
jgi:hypothetical protein